MEAYRSGHNEPHSKCGCPQGHVGSNPTASVRILGQNRCKMGAGKLLGLPIPVYICILQLGNATVELCTQGANCCHGLNYSDFLNIFDIIRDT